MLYGNGTVSTTLLYSIVYSIPFHLKAVNKQNASIFFVGYGGFFYKPLSIFTVIHWIFWHSDTVVQIDIITVEIWAFIALCQPFLDIFLYPARTYISLLNLRYLLPIYWLSSSSSFFLKKNKRRGRQASQHLRFKAYCTRKTRHFMELLPVSMFDRSFFTHLSTQYVTVTIYNVK